MNDEYLNTPENPDIEEQTQLSVEPPTPGKKAARNVGLALLFLFLLLSFTLLKLPQTRVTGLLQSYVQAALDPYGIYLSDRGRELAVWSGFRYRLEHPTLEFADQTRVELDQLTVAPKFSAMIQGKMGVHAQVTQGASTLDFDGSGRGDKVSAKIDLSQVDVGRFGLLSYAAGLKGSGTVTGTIRFEGALSDPNSLNGNIDLKVKSLKLDEQNLMGFALPALNISDGTIKIDIVSGKLLFKTFNLGKANDDLLLNLSGDIALNRYLNASTLNLKANFAFSDKVRQSLALLDSILASARLPDGHYAYRISGTLASPFPAPDPLH